MMSLKEKYYFKILVKREALRKWVKENDIPEEKELNNLHEIWFL